MTKQDLGIISEACFFGSLTACLESENIVIKQTGDKLRKKAFFNYFSMVEIEQNM